MQRLRDNAKDNTRETVPEVLWDYTTRRILAAEFLEGETVLAYLRALERGDTAMLDRLDAAGLDSHEVASNIIDNFLGDVFRHGMYHADLHPANLMILPGNVVGYIDFGITGTISRYSRQNLVALTLAYTRGDLKGMCDAFFSVSAMDVNSDAERFQEGLKRAAETWYEKEGKERRLRKNFTLVMLDMLHLSRRTGIWPERDVIKYIRSAIAIDGLITRFAPTFGVGRHLEMVCDRYLRWQARHALFAYSALASFVAATSNMVHDGPLRLGRFFQRTATGQMSAWADVDRTYEPSDRSLQRRTMQLAAIIFMVSSIIVFTGVQVRLGANLFTVETVFLACAAITLLQTIRRLKKEGRINHA
jgi:ubiquinone biosynthesis protein